MPRIKLTKPAFANLTGKMLGAVFTNGVSNDVNLSIIDAIAAAIGGNLVQSDGTTVIGPAGAAYRKTTVTPTREFKYVEPLVAQGSESTRVKSINAATYSIVAEDFGFILDFAVGTTITVPNNLPAAFNCALRQGGVDQIEVVAGGGAVVEEIDNQFTSEKRLAILTLARFPNGKFQLIGRTV
jgi:hypothetical protein